jgi:transcriptional regulator with XRE-family HTH domain
MDQAPTPANVLAHELSAWRDRTKTTAQQLAERITELGGKLTRQAISKIENGQRGVSIDELFLIARALRVPPALLLFPVGRSRPKDFDEVELAPGTPRHPWTGLRWFVGDIRFPSENAPQGNPAPPGEPTDFYDDPEEGWEQWAAPTLLFREHQHLIAEWWAIPPRLRELPFGTDAEKTAVRDAQQAQTKEKLLRVREEMKRAGLTPPPFPRDLEEGRFSE